MQGSTGTWGIALKVSNVALCLIIMNGIAYAEQTDTAVATTLLALSCALLAERLWRTRPEMSGVPGLIFSVGAMMQPALIPLIAVVVFDAGRLSGPDETSSSAPRTTPRWLPLAQRWGWVAPLALAALLTALDGNPATTPPTQLLWFSAALACVAWVCGAAYRQMIQLAHEQIAVRDDMRQMQRRWHEEITDARREQASSVRTATLSERTRIARQIHDNVGHVLTRAIMQAQAGSVVAQSQGEVSSVEYLESLRGSLDDAMTIMRHSVHDLDEEGTDFAAAIEDAAQSMSRRTANRIDGSTSSNNFLVHLDNHIADAPPPVARCLAAVIREALSNAVRHGHATTASVTLHDYPALWQMVVFNPDAKLGGEPLASADCQTMRAQTVDAKHLNLRGMGLADIELRVRSLGGTSLCGPYDDGWRVFVSIPKAPWNQGNASKEPV